MLSQPARVPSLLIEEMGNGVVAFVPSTGRTVVLNAIGGALLDFCDGHHTPAQIAGEIVAVLPANLAQVTEDVTRSLEEYATLGLVVEGAGDGQASAGRPIAALTDNPG